MSRRTMLLLAIMATVLVTAGSVAWAATINGNNADNTLNGTKKADRINGRGGDDTLLARRGRDQLIGGADDDTLNGASGNDVYVFTDNWGSDVIFLDGQGSGTDTLDFPSTVIIENVIGGDAGDIIRGNESQNDLSGYFGDDVLYGLGGDDTLYGDDGNDDLIGYGGADYLEGGFGDDEIFAQDGESDEILCGEGNDVAYYDPAPTGGESPDTFLDGFCETIDDTVN